MALPVSAFPPRNRWKCSLSVVDGVVIKNFRDNPPVSRIAGRVLLDREERALKRLHGLEGVPRFVARPDAYHLHLSWLPGRPLCTFAAGELEEGFLTDLRRVFAEMHARGVAHGDAHQRNILVNGPRACLVDFATATFDNRGQGRFPSLYRWTRQLDDWSLYQVERRWFGRGTPPKMFLLFHILKRRRYRQAMRESSWSGA